MLDEVQLGLGGVVTQDTVVVAAFPFDPALVVLQVLWRTKQRDVSVLYHLQSPALVHCKLPKAPGNYLGTTFRHRSSETMPGCSQGITRSPAEEDENQNTPKWAQSTHGHTASSPSVRESTRPSSNTCSRPTQGLFLYPQSLSWEGIQLHNKIKFGEFSWKTRKNKTKATLEHNKPIRQRGPGHSVWKQSAEPSCPSSSSPLPGIQVLLPWIRKEAAAWPVRWLWQTSAEMPMVSMP